MFDGLIDDNLPGVIKIMMVRNPAESSTIRIKESRSNNCALHLF